MHDRHNASDARRSAHEDGKKPAEDPTSQRRVRDIIDEFRDVLEELADDLDS